MKKLTIIKGRDLTPKEIEYYANNRELFYELTKEFDEITSIQGKQDDQVEKRIQAFNDKVWRFNQGLVNYAKHCVEGINGNGLYQIGTHCFARGRVKYVPEDRDDAIWCGPRIKRNWK